MSDTYNDEFKMRSFTKEEQEVWNEHIKSLSTPCVMVNKEKYDRLKEAFLKIVSYSYLYSSQYQDLIEELINEDGDILA